MSLLTMSLAVAACLPQIQGRPRTGPQLSPLVIVKAETLFTMAGEPMKNVGIILRDEQIVSVGTLRSMPADVRVIEAKVVTPGLIDAHSVVGLSGVLNVPQDQDQLDESSPMQPELRAIDAYNAHDPLVAWVRGLGVTTVHTGHAPGALVSGQTMVVKTHGRSVEKDVVRRLAMVAVTLADSGRVQGGKSPGTRAKSVAMLRELLVQAREYAAKKEAKPETSTDLRLDAMAQVLSREVPLLVTAHRAHDIASALRLAKEFGVEVVLDGAAESYLMLPEIRLSESWVLPHPAMARARGDRKNGTMELAKLLHEARVPFAMQTGFEGYVPKSRVLLWETAISVKHGLPVEQALRAMTIEPARMLQIDHMVGTVEKGKVADLALFDGDPFEYTTHCIGVIIDGIPYVDEPK